MSMYEIAVVAMAMAIGEIVPETKYADLLKNARHHLADIIAHEVTVANEGDDNG